MAEGVETDGVVGVGEVITRVYREALVEDDYTQAQITGATRAYETVALFARERIAAAGPYDDMRAMEDLVLWVADRIREAHQIKETSDGD
jgi:hypothetical protein